MRHFHIWLKAVFNLNASSVCPSHFAMPFHFIFVRYAQFGKCPRGQKQLQWAATSGKWQSFCPDDTVRGQKKAMSLCAEVPSAAVLLHLALNGCNGVAHRFTLVCCYCSLCLRLSLIVDYLSQAVAASSNCASLFQR